MASPSNSDKKDKNPYLDPYQKYADQHGSDFGVTLWANPETQTRRFRVFTQMCYMHGKRILDAGCSRGDLATFLLEQPVHYESYVGVDGLQQVIDFANQRKLPSARFICADFVTDPASLQADTGNPQIICISGTLNTMTDAQAITTLDAAWAATSESLIFNFLSDQSKHPAPPQTAPARRMDTIRLLEWSLLHTPLISFRQDYFPGGHDATILMRKEQPPTT